MANEVPTADEHISRISDRLRKDHPDPAIRAELYADGKLGEYVRTLMNGVDDDALIEQVIAGVRSAEDGTPAHHE